MNDLPLHDIHLPAAVSSWPPAIGWWLLPLIALLLGLVIYKLIQLKKQYKPAPDYKKIALQEIKTLEKEFKNNPASIELLRSISSLLRRIALSYLPRQSIASLTGEQWVEQLNRLAGETVFTPELATLLVNAPYQANAQFNQNELLDTCKQWIKQLPEKTHQATPQNSSMAKNNRSRGEHA
ncbi:hypothetical protein MNBD_GAMMA09-3465 [hydrothermal vent metagenome]|uniref:DUF4381 domain-containing protein n=1 Tax=hydrothermal vent metagenome TaxID=652676 RepID=A0A3B0XD67_9ZZZZ